MQTKELKEFVLQHFELGAEFPSPAAWAAYLRSAFPSASDDEIVTQLCEIVDGLVPNREKANPKIVDSHFGENGKMDFTAPNHRALTQMDSFLQCHPSTEKRWERTVRFLYQEDGGIGWEGVQKNRPDLFQKAWNEAVEFCESTKMTWAEIANA